MTTLGITYTAQRLKDVVKEAESMGFDVMSAPSIGIDPGDESAYTLFQSSVVPGASVVFVSTEAVDEAVKRLGSKFAGMLEQCKVIAMDQSAARMLVKNGVKHLSVSTDLATDVGQSKVVLAGPEEATRPLASALGSSDVVECAVCKIRRVGMGNGMFHMMIAIKRGRLDVMALTSPVAASDFMSSMTSQYGKDKALEYLSSIKVVAIDAETAQRLQDAGREPDMVTSGCDVPGMFKAIKESL
jgi:uroporphyrinogen-III synthase